MDETEIELEITKLMQDLQQNAIVLESTLAPFSRLIENISKDMKELSEPFDKRSVEIQDKIKELMLVRAKSLKTGSGNIIYKKGGTRRKWDLDALDKVCEENKDIKENIWKYRFEDEFPPQVLIKVETKGKSIMEI